MGGVVKSGNDDVLAEHVPLPSLGAIGQGIDHVGFVVNGIFIW
jgi:hypothetical protein